MTTKANWLIRKERYGPTGAKNPKLYRERARQAHIGKKPDKLTFKGHNLGPVCAKCEREGKHGRTHGSIESHTKNLQRWRQEHGGPTKGCNFGNVCRKCGVSHGPAGMKGKHHSEQSKRKSSESNKLAHNTPKMLAKKSDDARRQWMKPEVREKIRVGSKLHDETVLKDAELLRQQGYEVLPLDRVVRPDALAKKDGKIYPVEVDFDRNTPRNKYGGITFFDGECIWFTHEHPKYSTFCQTCGKSFKYMSPTPPLPKFCSRACYWKSLEGKVPVAAMRARGLA